MLSEDELDDLIADTHFQQGRDYERERIISLLETHDFGPTTSTSVLRWNMNLRHIIKLIKEDKSV
jgi:hypothetical protein